MMKWIKMIKEYSKNYKSMMRLKIKHNKIIITTWRNQKANKVRRMKIKIVNLMMMNI